MSDAHTTEAASPWIIARDAEREAEAERETLARRAANELA